MMIPRMELQAAVLGVKVDAMLGRELELQLDKSILWTDGTTVLKYINNVTKHFQTFEANRIPLSLSLSFFSFLICALLHNLSHFRLKTFFLNKREEH